MKVHKLYSIQSSGIVPEKEESILMMCEKPEKKHVNGEIEEINILSPADYNSCPYCGGFEFCSDYHVAMIETFVSQKGCNISRVRGEVDGAGTWKEPKHRDWWCSECGSEIDLKDIEV